MKYLFIADVKNVGFFILSYLQKHMSIDDTDEVFKGRYWDRFYHHDNKSIISGYRIKYKSDEIIFRVVNNIRGEAFRQIIEIIADNVKAKTTDEDIINNLCLAVETEDPDDY